MHRQHPAAQFASSMLVLATLLFFFPADVANHNAMAFAGLVSVCAAAVVINKL